VQVVPVKPISAGPPDKSEYENPSRGANEDDARKVLIPRDMVVAAKMLELLRDLDPPEARRALNYVRDVAGVDFVSQLLDTNPDIR